MSVSRYGTELGDTTGQQSTCSGCEQTLSCAEQAGPLMSGYNANADSSLRGGEASSTPTPKYRVTTWSYIYDNIANSLGDGEQVSSNTSFVCGTNAQVGTDFVSPYRVQTRALENTENTLCTDVKNEIRVHHNEPALQGSTLHFEENTLTDDASFTSTVSGPFETGRRLPSPDVRIKTEDPISSFTVNSTDGDNWARNVNPPVHKRKVLPELVAVKQEPLPYSSTSECESSSPDQVQVSFFEEHESVAVRKPKRGRPGKSQKRSRQTTKTSNKGFKPKGSKKSESGTGKTSQAPSVICTKTCNVCQKTFSRMDSLTRHMRVHTGERPYVCEYCSASYKILRHLKDHVHSKHTKTEPYKCEKCDKSFAYSTARYRHEKVCGKKLSDRVEFQCAKCERGFVTAQGYEKHQKSCDASQTEGGSGSKADDLPFICNTCEKRFESFPGLDHHQRFLCGRSPQKGSYTCEECGKVFRQRNVYISHTRRHVGEKLFKCSQCDASFYDNHDLQRHMKRHNASLKCPQGEVAGQSGTKKFQCSSCDAAFCNKQNLAVHVMRIHNGMKPHKCSECELDFSCQRGLSKHIRRVHRKEQSFKCTLCSKEFFDSYGLNQHMRRHSLQSDKALRGSSFVQRFPGTCKFCQKSVSSKDLPAHLASEHPGVTLYQAVRRKMVRCDICSKTLFSQDALRNHKFSHSGLRPFKCDQCEKSFKFRAGLIMHQRKHTDYRPHSCPDCGQKFRWAASLHHHRRSRHNFQPVVDVEKDNKRFICHECGKIFKRQVCLSVHMKLHAGVFPHVCPYCGKRFAINSRLKIHMSIHDGPKPFICETCGDGFFYKFLLEEHVRRKHLGIRKKGWLCDECGKSYCKRSYLVQHKKIHARYPDRKIIRRGRRKGVKHPLKLPKLVVPTVIQVDDSNDEEGPSQEVIKSSDSVGLHMDTNTLIAHMTDPRPESDTDTKQIANAMDLRVSALAQQTSPCQFE
ncbi:zinc finger protein 595-like [Littorina saxatilis]|uniref:zinc finger protein 595-like n=1 Tax=Littorina saxatilis TaxID=31220 RepID=UPI0038B5DFF3